MFHSLCCLRFSPLCLDPRDLLVILPADAQILPPADEDSPPAVITGQQVVKAQVDGQVSPVIFLFLHIRNLIDDNDLTIPGSFRRVYFDLFDHIHVLKNLIFQIKIIVMDLILFPHMPF